MSLLTNLVAYWNMDAGSGDDELDQFGSNDLIAQAITGTDPSGVVNSCRHLSSEHFECADNSDISTGDIDFTWGVWVNMDSVNTDYFIAKYDDGANEVEYFLRYNSAAGYFEFGVSNDGSATTVVQATTFGGATHDVWYHVVAWHDSVNNQLGIAVNNGTADTTSYSDGVRDGSADLWVGAANKSGGGGSNFSGLLDEIGFWKRVLTPTDRTNLYAGGLGNTYPFPWINPVTTSVNDSITVSESQTVALSTPTISVSDSLTVTDVPTVSVPGTTLLSLSVSDTVTLTESASQLVTFFVNKSDTVTLTESVTVQNLTCVASVSDSIAVAESVSRLVTLRINTSDSVALTESMAFAYFNFLTKHQSVALTEFVSIAFARDISVNDTITVAESRSVAQALAIHAAEDVALATAPTVARSVHFVQPNPDSVTVSESVSLILVLTIHAADSVGVAESTTAREHLVLAVSQAVSATESVQTAGSLRVSLSDTVGVGEALSRTLVLGVSKSETITVAEGGSTITRPWVPTDLASGLVDWHKADSLSLNDGDLVASWSDSSGNGHTATQSTTNLKPTYKTNIQNGLPVVRFSIAGAGGENRLGASLTLAQPFQIYTVAKPTLTDATQRIWLLGGFQLGQGFVTGDTYISAGALLIDVDSSTWRIRQPTFNGLSSEYRFDGGTPDSGNAGTTGITGSLTIGDFCNIDFGEYVIVSAVLSTTDRQLVEGYLAWKWGIQANLPLAHPYKAAAPTVSAAVPKLEVTNFINKSDSVTLTESHNETKILQVSVSEAIHAAEAINPNAVLFVNKSETISVAEFTNAAKALQIQATETLSVAESRTVQRQIVTAGPFKTSRGGSNRAGGRYGVVKTAGARAGGSQSRQQ